MESTETVFVCINAKITYTEKNGWWFAKYQSDNGRNGECNSSSKSDCKRIILESMKS